MLNIIIALAFFLPFGVAWPALMDTKPVMKRADTRLNTGFAHPNPSFNAADQYVDVTPGSAHEFRAPGPGDQRGECPGLNAAANHGFLPRNGKPTLSQSLYILFFSILDENWTSLSNTNPHSNDWPYCRLQPES